MAEDQLETLAFALRPPLLVAGLQATHEAPSFFNTPLAATVWKLFVFSRQRAGGLQTETPSVL